MTSERNDPGGTEAAIASLLREREGAVMYGRAEVVKECDRELEARGYKPKGKPKPPVADEKPKGDPHHHPPQGRAAKPPASSKG